MAEKLNFHLVSPERELFAGLVDQVVVPGTEGDFGVLAEHAPVMATIRPGAITVFEDGAKRRIFVNGGFAEVTPEGLTVLAEDAVDVTAVDMAALSQELQDAREDAADAKTDEDREAAQAVVDRIEALQAAVQTDAYA